MGATLRKVTVNLPEELLERAQALTGKGITETLIEGLRELERGRRLSALRKLKGKIRLDLDLNETRS
jgi:hypothetical protein